MRYLVFESEEAALSAEGAIFGYGAWLAQEEGYVVDVSGIKGKRLGETDHSAPVIDRWDIPEERSDGKWVVIHPEKHPAASDPAMLESLIDLLSGFVSFAEEEAADWWFEVEDF